jgi:hypothetical protein
MRRISVRVVNFAGKGMEDHVRLDEVDDEKDMKDEKERMREEEDDDENRTARGSKPESPKQPPFRPLRGRTLGFLGPTNPVRLAMYRILVQPYVLHSC